MTKKCIIGFVRIRVTGSYCRKSIEVKNISSQSLKVKEMIMSFNDDFIMTGTCH